jgi:uncharacterized protein YeaO (DUF488 family)
MIKVKRAYEPHSSGDGFRILVDRMWPRGIKKEAVHIDKWLKEIAPSTGLRKWFNHDPDKWVEFSKKYEAELRKSSALPELQDDIAQHKNITLVYAARDEEHNNANVILSFLHQHVAKKK